MYKTYSERSAENARRALSEYLGVQNGRKLYVGMLDHDGLARAGGITDLDGDQWPAAHGAADDRTLVNEPGAGRLHRECDLVRRCAQQRRDKEEERDQEELAHGRAVYPRGRMRNSSRARAGVATPRPAARAISASRATNS